MSSEKTKKDSKPAEDKPKKEKKEEKEDGEEGEEEEVKDEKSEDLKNADVVTKYKAAAEIVEKALALVASSAVAGKRIVELCALGDATIVEALGKVYKGNKKLEKGIGFPTSVSVNAVVGHFSPLSDDKTVLKDGDLIKIDMGAHIDGYCAIAANTFVLNPAGGAVSGRQADVIMAAQTAAEAAIRLLKPGGKNTAVTDAIKAVAADFKVEAVQGVLSHSMKRYVIDGEKVILNRADPEQKVDEVTFEPYEVYAVDIVMSSGDGKPKEAEERTTIYKRAVNQTYQLKNKTSRGILSEIDSKFPTFPFSIRALDEKKVRFGIKECKDHNLVDPYPVLEEKEGEFVAQVKFTALLLSTGPSRITSLSPIGDPKIAISSTNALVNADIKALLATSIKKKPAAKKKKKPTTAAAAPGGGGDKKEANKKEESSKKADTTPSSSSSSTPSKKADAPTPTPAAAKTKEEPKKTEEKGARSGVYRSAILLLGSLDLHQNIGRKQLLTF